jgi:hypothetical protein
MIISALVPTVYPSLVATKDTHHCCLSRSACSHTTVIPQLEEEEGTYIVLTADMEQQIAKWLRK